MDLEATKRFVEETWRSSILPALDAYIRIPNQSPAFDAEWHQHGYMDAAVDLIASWIRAQNVKGLALEVVRLPGRTPLMFMEVGGQSNDTVLLYGHLDKQPPMHGWEQGLGPWQPVLRDDRLYGRGGADDGYSAFAAITAIKALQVQGVPHPRCVVVIEADEESGSNDLPAYIETLAARIGTPSLVVCLDSGCGNYDQLWSTTSLRGLLTGNLSVTILNQGVHSGAASGIVPSSFRIVRQLLARLEDAETGEILPRELHVDVPEQRREQMRNAARVLGDTIYKAFPFPPGVQPVTDDIESLLLNRTWKPALEITGAAGLPPLASAGNVLRPTTTLKLSLRLPPTLDANAAQHQVKKILERDPPYGCHVEFDAEQGASGWNAPLQKPWIAKSVDEASLAFFGRNACNWGEGGTIPFMGMLGERFPQAQFVITGVLGPQSNAHGPNEFLHLPTATKLTGCVARILADHFVESRSF
jgi:acetylornithine deacetylase/succinyl-diaminopimelate desuccinylase-like protein